MKLYVAYGSNLNLDQMSYRCPDALAVGTGVIEGYALKYRGFRKSAVATIIPEDGRSVPVLVWSISPRDEENLDIYEGYPRLYYKKNIDVQLDNGKKVSAMVYIMTDDAYPGTPSNAYVHTILSGYLQNHMNPGPLFDSLEENEKEVLS